MEEKNRKTRMKTSKENSKCLKLFFQLDFIHLMLKYYVTNFKDENYYFCRKVMHLLPYDFPVLPGTVLAHK